MDPRQHGRVTHPAGIFRRHVHIGRMGLILIVIIGAAAGFMATRLMRLDTDVPTTLAIGIGGALVGGAAIWTVLKLASWLSGFMILVIGAVALIWLWRTYGTRR